VKLIHQVVVFDAADLAAESSFWAGVFGGTVDADNWHDPAGHPFCLCWVKRGQSGSA
jgi:hypothetical protein